VRSNGIYFTDKFTDFWCSRYLDTQVAPTVISGLGFDPRSMLSSKILLKAGIKPKIIPIKFNVQLAGSRTTSIEKATDANKKVLDGTILLTENIEVDMFDSHNRPIGGRTVVEQLYKIRSLIENELDLILDIGGLPRSLFAPLLSYLLEMQDTLGFKNLHVASMPIENLDSSIKANEILDPNFMYGFDFPSGEYKLVWIPIIGKNDPDRLRKIFSKIEDDCIEICPVLPFRPDDPRKVDDLLMSLHDVLFNELRTIHNNIIYIDHRSPFFVYREIVALSDYYNKLLGDLKGDVKVLITPLDDKTSCVGAVLAAVERKLPIMYADTVRYDVVDDSILLNSISQEPLEIWVSGEAYE
jgi:hypothetical protein